MPSALAHDFLVVLEPYAPHLAEELNALLGNEGLLAWESWPELDSSQLTADLVDVPVQINGKVRTVIKMPADADAALLEERARGDEGIAQLLGQGEVVKVIAIPGRILNFVVKPR